MHWRRFSASSIPIRDDKAFDAWLHERWVEKDNLLATFERDGRFPCDKEAIERISFTSSGASSAIDLAPNKVSGEADPVYGYVGPNGPLEFIQIFASILAVPIVWKGVAFLWAILRIVFLIASLGQVRI